MTGLGAVKGRAQLICTLGAFAMAASVPSVTPALAQKAGVAVDITANSMTIYEKEFRAVFKGKVDAVRGQVKLKSDRLDVKYAEVRRKDGSKKTEIRFLNARGNVVIISRGQTIKSQRARMDVKASPSTRRLTRSG